jgi:hypothetical protein
MSTGRRKIYLDCILANSTPPSHISGGATCFRFNFKEAIVIKNYAPSDVMTKIMYLSLAAAAFVFISMLLLAGVHP